MTPRTLLNFGIVCLFIALISCNDDDDVMQPVDLLTGNYTGIYGEYTCPPGGSIELEGVVTRVTENTEMSANFVVSIPGLGDALNFVADIQTDTSFTIAPFDLDGDEVYGQGRFGDDEMRFWLQDGCTFLGTEVSIATFVGMK